MQEVHLFVLNGMADWEPGFAIAAHKQTDARHVVWIPRQNGGPGQDAGSLDGWSDHRARSESV